jgi:hypothetical protein
VRGYYGCRTEAIARAGLVGNLVEVFLGFGASAAARCRFEAGSLILAIQVRLAAVLGWWWWRLAVGRLLARWRPAFEENGAIRSKGQRYSVAPKRKVPGFYCRSTTAVHSVETARDSGRHRGAGGQRSCDPPLPPADRRSGSRGCRPRWSPSQCPSMTTRPPRRAAAAAAARAQSRRTVR